MFLHVGENTYVLKKDIVAIFNAKTLDFKKKNWLNDKLMEFNQSEIDDAKSFIIVHKDKRNRKRRKLDNNSYIYISNISSTTLLKRF